MCTAVYNMHRRLVFFSPKIVHCLLFTMLLNNNTCLVIPDNRLNSPITILMHMIPKTRRKTCTRIPSKISIVCSYGIRSLCVTCNEHITDSSTSLCMYIQTRAHCASRTTYAVRTSLCESFHCFQRYRVINFSIGWLESRSIVIIDFTSFHVRTIQYRILLLRKVYSPTHRRRTYGIILCSS